MQFEILYYHKVKEEQDKPAVTHLTRILVTAASRQEAINTASAQQPEETYLVKCWEAHEEV